MHRRASRLVSVLLLVTLLGGLLPPMTPADPPAAPVLGLPLPAPVAAAEALSAAPAAPPRPPARDRLPLAFEPNVGQTDAQVRFVAHSAGGKFFFTPDEVVVALGAPTDDAPHPPQPPAANTRPVLCVRWVGANAASTLVTTTPLDGRVNYLLGNAPSQWRTNVATYASLTYQNLYSGISLAYEGTGRTLKGTYTVAPGADPTQIRWRYSGADQVQVDTAGQLQLQLRPIFAEQVTMRYSFCKIEEKVRELR